MTGPLLALSAALGPAMLEIDSQLVTEPRRTISRLRRDTRYTKDKSLYRDVIWCVFLRDKKRYSSMPGFVFECSPRMWRYGMGYWQTSPATMDCARELICEGHPAFLRALACYESLPTFPASLYSCRNGLSGAPIFWRTTRPTLPLFTGRGCPSCFFRVSGCCSRSMTFSGQQRSAAC